MGSTSLFDYFDLWSYDGAFGKHSPPIVSEVPAGSEARISLIGYDAGKIKGNKAAHSQNPRWDFGCKRTIDEHHSDMPKTSESRLAQSADEGKDG
jgi:hypothetical protein